MYSISMLYSKRLCFSLVKSEIYCQWDIIQFQHNLVSLLIITASISSLREGDVSSRVCLFTFRLFYSILGVTFFATCSTKIYWEGGG